MINWEKLDNKFGKSGASKKFEDMALDYVRQTYSEYVWEATKRTRDGNRDFQSVKNELLNIWGEAKYKKYSTSLTRKDLDSTILSGLINGSVELIIFVTNGRIPEELIERTLLGAKLKGIKLSFILGHQLASWLIFNPNKYHFYFEEKLDICQKAYLFEQSIEIKQISFYDILSMDFQPNTKKAKMLVGETFILSYIIITTQCGKGRLFFEDNFPFSIIKDCKYDDPHNIILDGGINIINLMVKATSEYNDTVRMGIEVEGKHYFYITSKIIIKSNPTLTITHYKQLNIVNTIKGFIDTFSYDIGSYLFFIHGKSGMGKSYILNLLSHNYSMKNDITLVTFEKTLESNINYLWLCRVLIYLQYGNLFWNSNLKNIKKVCLSSNNQDVFTNNELNAILNGCFDSNIAKTVIESMLSDVKSSKKNIIISKKQKYFRILLLDDIQFLAGTQSEFLKCIILQQTLAVNNNIIIISGTKNKFYDKTLEKLLINNINNYYELDSLSESDIKATLLQNISSIESYITISLVKKFPTNLLIFTEVLFNLKKTLPLKSNVGVTEFIEYCIELLDEKLVFQNKFVDFNSQFYLLDIVYLFKKGIPLKWLYKYPSFNISKLKSDFKLLLNENLIKMSGENLVLPYHDYVLESYKKLRKGKEYNVKTGDFFKFVLNNKRYECDTNYLLNIICKCSKKYFNFYNDIIKELMIKYINSSQYGTAIYFAELFYKTVSAKEILDSKEKYYLYLYADCLVHSDNQYRAKEILEKIKNNSPDYSFEKYESAISLLNQKFWRIDIDGVIEDSKIYQIDLETMFMHQNMINEDKERFIKAYEACFNRRMVTLLLIDEFKLAQKAYQEGLIALKNLSQTYDLEYMPLIATLIMDYARGNMSINILLANKLLNIAKNIFNNYKLKYVRRHLICQVDLLVTQHMLRKKINYIELNNLSESLNKNHYTYEYIKAKIKICACRFIDYSTTAKTINDTYTNIPPSRYVDIIAPLQNSLLEKNIILKNKERFMYNYLISYIYILQNDFRLAEKCLLENLDYIEKAGDSYKKPLNHNIENIRKIKFIDWYRQNEVYPENVYIIESRFW